MSQTSISPKDLYQRLEQGQELNLIDVRTPVEFREIHATIARNHPLDSLDPKRLAEQYGTDEPLYVICRSGSRSQMACDKLSSGGVKVVNVEGGTNAWEQAGLPVVRGKKAVSLDRQVRITAGSLVLIGLGLYFVSPWFLLVSAFIGSGLVFSGVTDTCAMGMMLSKMPWNQVRSSETCDKPGMTPSQQQGCCS